MIVILVTVQFVLSLLLALGWYVTRQRLDDAKKDAAFWQKQSNGWRDELYLAVHAIAERADKP